MRLHTIQIPISLDVFDFHLKNFIQDFQLYMSDEKIAVKTESKKNAWARYEILFSEECNTVNNCPKAIFGQIESIVINDTLIEMRAAVIRMEEVPIASDFFSKFYKMVIEKWNVIHDNIFLSNEFNEILSPEEVEEIKREVDTGWNGEGDALVYAYEKLVRHSGIDSKYLPYFPYEIVLHSGDLILYAPITDPLHQQHDDPDYFWEKYLKFKEELNLELIPIEESKRGKQGPSARIEKRAKRAREIKRKNPSLSRAQVAKKLTKVYKDEIEEELREKHYGMSDDDIGKKILVEFYKEAGENKKEFTADDIRHCYNIMDWDDWIRAKKGK